MTKDLEFAPAIVLENALYVVATPIGNLADITVRALSVLKSANIIACEDTRTTRVLLQRYGIETPCVPYHEHNAERQSGVLVKRLQAGQSVALVSDAGTPLVSDPGLRLVRDAIAAGFKLVPLPGATSPIVALSASGLSSDAFFFAGFLPTKKVARQKRLSALLDVPGTLIFLESPRRLLETLEDAVIVFGKTLPAVVAREMTKIHEVFERGTLGELSDRFKELPTPKGEIVLLIDRPPPRKLTEQEIDEALIDLLKTKRVKEAADVLASNTGLAKRDLYQRALVLKDADGG